ncbi:YceI family protein [Alcaligenaceae bacterium]|nr:YceI family protein [Alcaligenaceae bacterium]
MTTSLLRPMALAAVLSLNALGSASAAEYTTLNPAASQISFAYSQMGVGMKGSFGDLKTTEFRFDPASPETAKVAIEIPLSSIDAGYSDANAELEKPEWLNMAAYPLAEFTSSTVQPLGDNRYQVNGVLAIKGKTQEVSAPFTFTESEGNGIFEGSFTFQRADFDIGDGQWKDFSIVANDIQITFQFVANS